MASKQARSKSPKKLQTRGKLQTAGAERFLVARRTAIVGGVLFTAIILMAAIFWPLPDEQQVTLDLANGASVTGPDVNGLPESLLSTAGSISASEASAIESAKRWVTEVSLPAPVAIEFDTIQAELRKAIEELLVSYPDDYKTQHLAGLVYSQLKQSSLAESALRKSVELNGRDVQVRIDLAKELMQTGRDDEALEILLQVDSAGTQTRVQVPGQVKEQVQDHADALSLLRAELLSRLGKLEEAVVTLRDTLKVDSRSAAHWLQLGKLQFQLGDWSAASESIRKSIVLDGENEQAWLALCQVLGARRATDELAAAKAEFEKLRAKGQERQRVFEEVHVHSLRRFAVSSYRSAALLYFEHRQAEAALFWFKRALELEPSDLPTLNGLAAYYRRIGRLDLACELSRLIVAAGPNDYVNYTNLASLCMESSDAGRAEAVLRLASERAVAPEQSHLNLAKFLLVLHRPEQAVAAGRLAVAQHASPEGYAVLADALDATGNEVEAEAVRVQSQRFENNSRPLVEAPR